MANGIAFLTVSQVAEQLALSPVTIYRYIRDKKLEAVQTPGGHWRIKQASVEDMMVAQKEYEEELRWRI